MNCKVKLTKPADTVPAAAWLAVTSLSFLKPRLRRSLQPIAAMAVRLGVTANQVTLASLAGSILVGALLTSKSEAHGVFILLPAWLVMRTFLAGLDGTLALDFGQKSRLGGVLNEVGDLISDIVLYSPFVLIAPFSPGWVLVVIGLAVICELIGITAGALNLGRRCEGPAGKTDRSFVFGLLGLSFSLLGTLPVWISLAMPLIASLLVLTAVNRVRFSLATYFDQFR